MDDRVRKNDRRTSRTAGRRRRQAPLEWTRLEDRTLLAVNFSSTFALGGSFITASRVQVDSFGDTIVVGGFQGSMNFDPNGSTVLTSQGNEDIFVAKYSPSGKLIFADDFGGVGNDIANGVAVDSSGNIAVVGQFQNSMTMGGTTLTSAGQEDVFVAKLGPAGNVIWAQRAGGAGSDIASGVAFDPSGNVAVSGEFQQSATFGGGSGGTVTSAGDYDGFIAKYDGNGNFQWVDRVGGSTIDQAPQIGVDGSGNIYSAGFFNGTANLTQGSTTLANFTSNGAADVFFVKLTPAGGLGYAKSFGGSGSDTPGGIAVDSAGDVVITGSFSNNVNFNPAVPTPGSTVTSAGFIDAFIVKFDPNGNYQWVRAFGGPSNDNGVGVAFDSAGDVYATGNYFGNAYTTPPAYTFNSPTNVAAYVFKFDPFGTFVSGQSLAANGADANGRDIAVSPSGALTLVGSFAGSIAVGNTNLTAPGASNIFIARRNVALADYSGAGSAQMTVYQPSTSTFFIQGVGAIQFGQGTQYGGSPIPVAADFDGDGRTDIAVFQPSTSTFYVAQSALGSVAIQFGQGTQYGGNPMPFVADYAGTGHPQIGVFQPDTSTFYIQGVGAFQFGQGRQYGGDPIPFVADYAGTGRPQLIVYQPGTSTFYIQGVGAIQFGQGRQYGGNPIPFVADIAGTGHPQLIVYQPSNSTFYVMNVGFAQFGQGTLYGGNPVPIITDFNGVGHGQLTVFQPSTSTFYVQGVGAFQFGQGTQYGGNPVPLPLSPINLVVGNTITTQSVSRAAAPTTLSAMNAVAANLAIGRRVSRNASTSPSR